MRTVKDFMIIWSRLILKTQNSMGNKRNLKRKRIFYLKTLMGFKAKLRMSRMILRKLIAN